MRKTHLSPLSLLLPLIAVLLTLSFLTGCDDNGLRFAASDSQKQLAYHTDQLARVIDAQGAEAGSPATGQLITGTTASLSYIGPPKKLEPISADDFPTTAQTAQDDAQKRPTGQDIAEAVDKGLDLTEGVLYALGLGGIAFGGRKLTTLIKSAKEKSAALQEVIAGNSDFLHKIQTMSSDKAADDLIAEFKASQNKVQNTSTKRLVAEQVKYKTV